MLVGKWCDILDKRLVTSDLLKEDIDETNIRPQSLEEYVGQSDVKENIKVLLWIYRCTYRTTSIRSNVMEIKIQNGEGISQAIKKNWLMVIVLLKMMQTSVKQVFGRK